MAFPAQTTVQPMDDAGDKAGLSPKTPPAQSPKPKTQKKDSPFSGSLFGKAGAAQTGESSAGLGSEGSDPSIIGTQGYALVQRGIQMLNLAFPDSPGLGAVLTDIMGRLQLIIPQILAGQNQSTGMGMFGPGAMGGQPGMPGAPPAPGAPGMGPGMGGPPGMAPGMAQGGPVQPPMMPPPQQ